MELFKREQQHEPVQMLLDVLKLYQLHYGISKNEAIKLMRADLQDNKVDQLPAQLANS